MAYVLRLMIDDYFSTIDLPVNVHNGNEFNAWLEVGEGFDIESITLVNNETGPVVCFPLDIFAVAHEECHFQIRYGPDADGIREWTLEYTQTHSDGQRVRDPLPLRYDEARRSMLY